MCDRNDTPGDDIIGNQVYQRFKKQLVDCDYKTKCRKCSINDGYVLLQKKDIYCGPCLVEYCKHKFRATLGKSKLLTPGEMVLVGLSGGTSSIALVDLIKIGLAEDIHRRLRLVPALLHIDESILNDSSQGIRREIFDFMMESGFDCYFTSLDRSINHISNQIYIHIEANDEKETNDSKYDRVQTFLLKNPLKTTFIESLKRLNSSSSKYDFISRLKNLIMVKIASLAGFRRVATATTATELSCKMMTDISMGRGIELQAEMSFCDDRYSDVTIIRPMREFLQKDLAFYLRFRKLHLLVLKTSLETNMAIKSSINRLTENFLNTLAEEFPSTIYTVFKTGNKITSTKGSVDCNARCQFCWSKIDINQIEDDNIYTAYDALRLTSKLSCGIDQNNAETKTRDSSGSFCYGCNRISSEMGTNHFELFCILNK